MGVPQSRFWSGREWVSRLLGGASLGSVVLVLFCYLGIAPFLGSNVNVALHGWVLLIPKYALPATIVLGGLAGLAWRRSRKVLMSRGWLVGSCLVVALMAQLLRPHLSRIRQPGFGPLYEEVPDTLAMVFCLIGLVVLAFDPGIKPSTATDPEDQSGQGGPIAFGGES